jgi:hypothetical protein
LGFPAEYDAFKLVRFRRMIPHRPSVVPCRSPHLSAERFPREIRRQCKDPRLRIQRSPPRIQRPKDLLYGRATTAVFASSDTAHPLVGDLFVLCSLVLSPLCPKLLSCVHSSIDRSFNYLSVAKIRARRSLSLIQPGPFSGVAKQCRLLPSLLGQVSLANWI